MYGARRLAELLPGRPPGVTGHQRSSAGRESFDYVVCAADAGRPLYAGWEHRFSCGVDPGRLAEDLAAAAVGERLHALDTVAPDLVPRERLDGDIRRLRERRDEMRDASGFAHLCAD